MYELYKSKMYWIRTLLVFHLAIHSLNAECFLDTSQEHNYSAECISMNEEKLLTFIRTTSGCSLKKLKIENISIPFIEKFPIYRCHALQSLSIKNSNIRSIIKSNEGLGGYTNLEELDLSFNHIMEISFLKSTDTLKKIVVNHNQIELLNGSDLANNIHLRYLDLSYNNIKNSTELANKRLHSLNLSHNLIERIGNLLSNLEIIEMVDFSYNELKTVFAVDFGNLRYIRSLNLKHNDIISVQYDARTFPREKTLFWRNGWNGIVDLSFNNMKRLNDMLNGRQKFVKTINFENNGLTDLQFLLFNDSRNVRGKSIIFRNNKIKTLYPDNFKGLSLSELDLSFNEIELILPSTFEGSHLKQLRLDHNKITSLNSSIFDPILSNLERLNLSFNPLTIIDGSVFQDLELISLDLSHCSLKNISRSLFENMWLSEIYLNHNNIESIEPNTFRSLDIVDLSFNKIDHLEANVFTYSKIAKYLNLSNNHLRSLKNVFNNSVIEGINLTGTYVSELSNQDLEDLYPVRYLDLSNTRIVELRNNTFDQLSYLKNLSLDDNSIRMIPNKCFNSNLKLMSLSIVRNPISMIQSEAFSHKMKLKYLYLTINGEILGKRFFNLIFLEELHIVHSLITELHENSFEGLVDLTKLNFENSTVLKVEPGAFLGLRNVLEFDERNLFANISTLRSRTFVGLESLESLNFSKIGIGSIEEGAFLGLDRLVKLSLDHNNILNLPINAFTGLKNLKMLDLSFNKLTTDENSTLLTGIFKDLIELKTLHLQHNQIDKLDIGTFTNLENLKFLNLSYNHLKHLDEPPLLPLRDIYLLDINSNDLYELNYTYFKGRYANHLLGIGENKWPCNKLASMLKYFGEQGINFRKISKLYFEGENIEGIRCIQ